MHNSKTNFILNLADTQLNSKCARDQKQGTKNCIYDPVYFEKLDLITISLQ